MAAHNKSPFGGVGAIFQQLWRSLRGTVSMWLVAACVTLFVLATVLEGLGVVSPEAVVSFLGLSYYGVFERYWLHQFVTAPLLHAGVSHLLFNMLSLWILGPAVEQVLGRRRYIVFSILCATSSMLGSLLVNWGTGRIVLGYSGVIFGILVAQAMLFPDSRIILYFYPVKMKYAALILGAVELLLTVSPEQGGIAHAAHLFGGAAGFVYLIWFRRTRRAAPYRRPLQPPARPAPPPRFSPQPAPPPRFSPRPEPRPPARVAAKPQRTRADDIPREL